MVESDEEQLEVLKKWWDENGTSLVVAVVLALGGSFGYRAWEDSVRETAEAASVQYENLRQASAAVADENLRTTALTLGEGLKKDHADSAYAVFAALHLAKLAVEEGNLDKAQAELTWALAQKPEPHLATIARMRLARVMLAKEDPTAAMAQLESYTPAASQTASWEEVRGDAFVVLGDDVNARASYQRALENLTDANARPLLELKLADIPLQTVITQEPAVEDDDA